MSTETAASDVSDHSVVPHAEWLESRKALLAKEKDFTKLRDELSAERRNLPWERVDKTYVFEGPQGKQTLSDLFEGRSQLIVYHFMFDVEEDVGCAHCSFWADNFNGITVHLGALDAAFVAVSRVPLAKIEAYRKRMGWGFTWLSSFENGFKRDFGTTFTADEISNGLAFYNYKLGDSPDTEREGLSVFYKNDDGNVFHTYSTYARGIDILNTAYNFIDMTPEGRNEGDSPQRWVRRHDEYASSG